jgi:hypothetical protein
MTPIHTIWCGVAPIAMIGLVGISKLFITGDYKSGQKSHLP